MKNRANVRHLTAIATFVPIAAGALAPACASAQALSDEWKFSAMVYFWMPEITGAATLPGNNTVETDLKFHTLLDTLKMAFMGSAEVQKGRWGAFTDLIYFNIGDSATKTRDGTIDGVPVGVNADLSLDFKAVVWTLGGSYRVQAEPGSSFDVLAGARMLELKPTLNFDIGETAGGVTLPNRTGTRSTTATNWDGIVGIKGRKAFGDKNEWFVPYYADVGTGQSRLTWQVQAGIGYVFSWGEFVATWRYLDWNMKSDDKIQGLTVNGPVLGAIFHW